MQRYSLILFFIFIFSLNASEEIQRIDFIVNDIATLRKSYEKKLLDAKEKNIILEQENRSAHRKIENLENEIEKLQTLLKNRKKQVKKEIIVKEKIKKVVLRSAYQDENPFPKLKLRNLEGQSKLYFFKASAFRLKKSANIYAGMNTMKVLYKWDKHTSFTSNTQSEKRIKITGFFLNKKWKKVLQEMWVDRSDVEQK